MRGPTSRTTFAYNGSSKLKRILDPAGRITTYTVDGSGDLTQITTPELCVTNLRYDGSHRLSAMIHPGGQRQTLNYDALGRVKAGVNPLGGRTSFSYLDWNTARVQGPRGAYTTLIVNTAKNIKRVIDPLAVNYYCAVSRPDRVAYAIQIAGLISASINVALPSPKRH